MLLFLVLVTLFFGMSVLSIKYSSVPFVNLSSCISLISHGSRAWFTIKNTLNFFFKEKDDTLFG